MLGYALFVCALARVSADAGADPGGLRQGLGPRLLARESHAAQFPLSCCSSRPRPSRPSSTPSSIRGITAFAAISLSLAIAYVVTRKLVPWSNVLAFLCMAPFVIPGIVLAIGFYAAYAPPPLALYGTATILILAFTTRFLPIAYTSSAAGMRSINPEMEEAVRILGGGRLLAIRRVLAPLLKRSLAGAWILVFIPATRELSSAIFLVGPNTRVISVMLFDLSEEGNFEVLSALGMILLVVTLVIAAIGFSAIGRDFMVRTS